MEQIRIDRRTLSLRAHRQRAEVEAQSTAPLRHAAPDGGGADIDEDLLERIGLLLDGDPEDDDHT